jgi:predicted nucleic acid-binding protein
MASHLLDTNILIRRLRNDQAAATLLNSLEQSSGIYISVVTRTEILAGMRPQQEERTLALLDSLIAFPVDDLVADQAGRWIYRYARRGIHLSVPDALIAATALLEELTLVTMNARHFPMPGLTVHAV